MMTNNKCGYCGRIHETTCPTIKAIEYYPDGSVKRVEFKTAADYGSPVSIPTVFTRPSVTIQGDVS